MRLFLALRFSWPIFYGLTVVFLGVKASVSENRHLGGAFKDAYLLLFRSVQGHVALHRHSRYEESFKGERGRYRCSRGHSALNRPLPGFSPQYLPPGCDSDPYSGGRCAHGDSSLFGSGGCKGKRTIPW